MVAEEMEIMAPANGNSKVVYIDLTNLGNYDESYTLELTQSNWKLQGYLSTDETPVLDAWDGSTTLALNLPMPIGLSPGLYTAKITATSKVDPTVSEDITINVDDVGSYFKDAFKCQFSGINSRPDDNCSNNLSFLII